MKGIGIYTLDKPVEEFQEQELIEFSESRYDAVLRTYGIRRLFPNEVFYTATKKVFLGNEADEAIVSVLHGMIYKVLFDFVHASIEEHEKFRGKMLPYLQAEHGEPTETRELPSGARLTIWDGDFGNLIFDSNPVHTSLILTSSSIRPKKIRELWQPPLIWNLGRSLLTWNASEHTDDENTRWCCLRAMEWVNWPMFLSPSLVPIMLLFWNWQIVALILVVCNWMWHFIVGRRGRFVSVPLAHMGVYSVKAKWIICPVVAGYFYYNGQTVESLISLLWPLFPYAALIPGVSLLALLVMPPAPVRPVQDRFMTALGYEPSEERERP